ncbi:uncharacterized protein LOC142100254 [Mixophyes fleayi]|uniref:uncharacterized protein LOC142100254 n=1 Tax=Mixophyes fleayi TaxID=3061075 RepID=UPI003F4E3E65
MSPREVEMMVKVLDQDDYDIKKERRIISEKGCLDTTDTTNVTLVIKQEKIEKEKDMKEVRHKEHMEVKPAIITIAPQGPKHKLISSSVQGKEIKGDRNPSDIKTCSATIQTAELEQRTTSLPVILPLELAFSTTARRRVLPNFLSSSLNNLVSELLDLAGTSLPEEEEPESELTPDTPLACSPTASRPLPSTPDEGPAAAVEAAST